MGTINWINFKKGICFVMKLGDVLWDCDWAGFNMHMEAMIERDWRCRLRPSDCGSLVVHSSAIIERDWSTWRFAGCCQTPFISWLTCKCGNVTRRLYHWALMESSLVAFDLLERHVRSWRNIHRSTWNHENYGPGVNLGWMVYSLYALHSVDCTRCMLYPVYAIPSVCCTGCMLYWMYAVLGVWCIRCML